MLASQALPSRGFFPYSNYTVLPLLRVRHRPYSCQPMVEHFRPWPRSIRCCSTKVNKILEALQTRVDRILHSLQTGIHWDIPLQRCRRKSGMNGDKRFAMRGCLWLRNLDALSQQYRNERAWEGSGCPKGLLSEGNW